MIRQQILSAGHSLGGFSSHVSRLGHVLVRGGFGIQILPSVPPPPPERTELQRLEEHEPRSIEVVMAVFLSHSVHPDFPVNLYINKLKYRF